MVAWFDRGDTLANTLYDTGALVTENDGECTFGVLSGKCVGV